MPAGTGPAMNRGAWATYHYGGWDFDPQFGWYWMPQIQWAPAWVSWREGGGYVGWAPLGPSGRFWGRSVARRGYVTVEERQFLEPVSPKTVIVDKIAINKTVIIKKGPNTAVIEKASGRKVEAVPVRALRNKEEAKVVARHPTPTSTGEKAVQTPVRSQAEKTLPASEPRQVAKPAMTTGGIAIVGSEERSPTIGANPDRQARRREAHPGGKGRYGRRAKGNNPPPPLWKRSRRPSPRQRLNPSLSPSGRR